MSWLMGGQIRPQVESGDLKLYHVITVIVILVSMLALAFIASSERHEMQEAQRFALRTTRPSANIVKGVINTIEDI